MRLGCVQLRTHLSRSFNDCFILLEIPPAGPCFGVMWFVVFFLIQPSVARFGPLGFWDADSIATGMIDNLGKQDTKYKQ